MAGVLAGTGLLASLGVAVGFITRNQTTAVLVVVGVWLFEEILGGLVPVAFGPYGLLDQFTAGQILAGVALVVLDGAALAAAVKLLERGDIV